MGIMYFSHVMATFLLLEAVQAHAVLTNMVRRGGLFHMETFLVIGWIAPILPVGLCTVFYYDLYPSTFRCDTHYAT